MNIIILKKLQLIIGAASLGLVLTASAAPNDPLESGWLNPPESAKPETWWQWMNGNISKEGITADLEAMKQIGLGGAAIVNTSCGIPVGKKSDALLESGLLGPVTLRTAEIISTKEINH